MGQTGSVPYGNLTQQVTANELSTLLKVSSALASTLELTKVMQIAVESAINLIGLDTGAIYLLEGDNLYLGATTPPLPEQFPEELRHAALEDHPHINETINKKTAVFLDDARTASLSPAEEIVVASRFLVSILYFPMLLKEEAIGAFIVGTTGKTRRFSENEINLCKILSYQVSFAVSNAQLYKEAQRAVMHLTQAYDATLEGWSRVLDMRDHITDEHTHRVADLTVSLARKMGFPESDLSHVRRGALLHDIGKMGIPDAILQKADKLTDSEKETMQAHPDLAYKLLSKIEYLAPAMDIPCCHHEKWDGTGYPRQLQGEEIPLVARIFAVVDVFDALTSDRPYRKAWRKEDALAYIQKQSGKHFYPEAVKAFFDLVEEQGL